MRTIRALWLGLLLLALVSACGFYGSASSDSGAGDPASLSMPPSGSGGSESAPMPISGAPPPPVSHDAIVAIPSAPGTLSVSVGGTQTLTVTFVSSDGLPIRGLEVSLTTPPAGWSGLEDNGCRSVGAGGSCTATLTYAPTSIDSGTLTLNYVFISNGTQLPGAIEIPYAATPNDNVVASASLTGQVDAAVGGGKQTVAVDFTTDDGNAATQLTVTSSLVDLPTGWSSGASGLSCAIVSTGSGCQLLLAFGPASITNGVLALDYSYVDDSGAPRTGTLNIPYAATSNGNIVASVAPSGQIIAVQGGGVQPVSINFTTADGRSASDLIVLSNLGTLPQGWTSNAAKFTCANVSTGNGCQLALTYAPQAFARGTLSLDYYYADAAGTFRIGTVDVPYAATTEDNVAGSATPSGQVSAIVGETSPSVVVTFTTDDGRPATALELTSGLSPLPAGWSSAQGAAFTCPGVSSGSGCQLMLSYTPVVADAGIIALGYSYLNDAGEARTGTVDIPFRATTDNQISAAPSLSPLAVMSGSVTPVTIAFTTNDGNPATGFAITSGLAPLPSGWNSNSGTFACATVDASGACVLDLTYAPTVPASGTLTLGFSYINNSGIAKTGTVSVDYTAGP